MERGQKNKIIFLTIILLIIFAILLYKSTQKIVYIEGYRIGQENDDALPIDNNNIIIEQEFTIPYKLFSGLGFLIGTNERDNNSRYEITVMDKTDNQKIAFFVLDSSEVKNNKIYDLLLDKSIRIDNTHTFSVTIQAKPEVDGNNSISFWYDKIDDVDKVNYGKFYCNNEEKNHNLCMNIYGGNANSFCFIFALGCEIYLASMIFYISYLYTHKKSIKNNKLVQTGVLGIIVFGLLSFLVKQDIFCDEVDNIIGGMLLTKGKILYNDYYMQHTPFAYLLCGIFALLKPGSIEQFRLIYYVFLSIVFMLLYYRHRDYFGTKKMFILPIVTIVICATLINQYTMILSDNIQAICMLALVLEFLRYWKDEKIDWKRSIIISLCIFCSFTSAFVSCYQIFAIVIGVLIKEIIIWKRDKNITIKALINRYLKLIVACIVPFILLIMYFIATNSLQNAYEQAFKFNTEVYSFYNNGFGENIFFPFFAGITEFIKLIPNSLSAICEGTNIISNIIKLVITISLFVCLWQMIEKKQNLKAVILFLFLSFGSTRTGFHASSVWTVMVTIVLLTIEINKIKKNKISQVVLFIITLLILGSFMDKILKISFKTAEPVTLNEQKIIQSTSDGEEIFLDCFLCQNGYNPVYMIYKNRLPVNRCCFILPWYMDWFETDTINDLRENTPNIVVYDSRIVVWEELVDFSDYLKKYINENYELVDGYDAIWIKK